MSDIRNAIPAVWTEKRALQARACPSCSRCMFWCSTSGYLAVRWHNGRLMHNVFAGTWRCCSEKLYQQQSLISSTPKCPLWLLQITKDLTETLSTILYRPCSAMLLWLFARMQPPPVMIQMLALP